jgi:hypothetical protein
VTGITFMVFGSSQINHNLDVMSALLIHSCFGGICDCCRYELPDNHPLLFEVSACTLKKNYLWTLC